MIYIYQYPSVLATISSNLLSHAPSTSASFFSISTYHSFRSPSRHVYILISFSSIRDCQPLSGASSSSARSLPTIGSTLSCSSLTRFIISSCFRS
jgi:hypothetical protein